jgi:hypothetical protein
MDYDLFHELLELWPDATKWKDRDGWHPLHLACLCHCPSTIARYVVGGCVLLLQQSRRELTNFIHYSTVLNAYPEAAAIADTEEMQFPLHIAALHGANGTLLQVRRYCRMELILCCITCSHHILSIECTEVV